MFQPLSNPGLVIPLAGVVGLFVGSFLNVVIYRAPRGLSVSTPRSFCPTCDRQLQWWENVPVASWLGLRGRCHTCRESISIRYPLVELATGLSFALITWACPGTVAAAGYCVLAATVIAVGLIEYGDRRAPVSVAVIGGGLALVIIVVGGAVQGRWPTVVGSLAGAMVGGAAYGVVRTVDPGETDPKWHGHSGLLLVGCWVGGLGVEAAALGVGAAVVVYLTCLTGARVTARTTVAAGGPRLAIDHRLHPVLGTPTVTAVAVAMVASMALGAG